VPKGTSFSVKNLFFNIPARRNFLKSDTVEFRHVIDEFERVALAHANIALILYHNGSEMFNLPSSNMRQRIVNIFGGRTNEKLVPVKESTEIVGISGFVTKPEFAKKSRGEQFFIVNNRFIKSGYLHHAVMAAYEGLLKDGCQPAYYIYLEVPPHTIDINIHPTKTEVKFDDEHALYAILRSTIKHSLGQFNVAPVLDFDRDNNLDTPYEYERREATVPTVQVDRDFNPFADEKPVRTASSAASWQAAPAFKRERQPEWESLYTGMALATGELEGITFETEEVTGSLFNDSEVEQAVYKTYQIHKKYIVSPIKSGLLVIDQKRAHQRILYEQFLTSITVHHAASQQLLFPLVLHYSPGELALIREMREALENTGFVFAEFNHDHIVVSGLPVNVSESEVSILLEELINDLLQEVPDSSFSQSDSIAKSMAKSLAVKTGTYMNEKEQENMVNALFACKEPDVSPFQRPTFITVSVEDLDKRFAI
jgi:DNA mismatch repair protein MutL